MSTHATGRFEYTRWDEQPYGEVADGAKLTRASVANAFEGDVRGKSTLEYLMVYRPDGSGRFVGFEQVVGSIGDRTGSFVLEHAGTFEGDAEADTWTIRCSWSVVPGSGTDALRNLRGEGGFVSGHGEKATPFTLNYDLG